MSMCRVVSCVVGRGCLLWAVCSFGKTVSLYPASFCIPRPNLPVTPGISWLPAFGFLYLMIERTSIFGLVLEGLVGLHRTMQRKLLQHYWLGHRFGSLWYWTVLFTLGPWNARVGSQEIPGVTGKFGLGVHNEAGQRLTEFCQGNTLITANTFFQQHKGNSTHGHHQMINNEIKLNIFFATEDGEALFSQQKQDQELTVAQIMKTLQQN